MKRQLLIATITALVCASGDVRAQTPFLRGQTIQPVYEGWQKNDDGTISMVFGYMNRNYEEEPFLPVGSDNFFAPGDADRGQPTHFDTRRQSFVFSVKLPADWGNQELVWTVKRNGQALTAIGSLMPHWILDEGVWRANRGAGISGRTAADYLINKPPTAAIVGPTTIHARVGEPITLTATATDDGKPGPKPKPKQGRAGGEGGSAAKIVLSNPDLPTVGGNHSGAASGTGGPTDQNVVQVKVAEQTGLAVTWRHYRGPGNASFEPRATPMASGQKVSTTVRVSEPGTHVIRAVADDSSFTVGADITVIVDSASTTKSDRAR